MSLLYKNEISQNKYNLAKEGDSGNYEFAKCRERKTKDLEMHKGWGGKHINQSWSITPIKDGRVIHKTF